MSFRRARTLAPVLLLFALGCFEIREVVKFNKDGSGSFSLLVGVQEQFRSLVAMSRKMEQENKKRAEQNKPAEGQVPGSGADGDSEMEKLDDPEEDRPAPDKIDSFEESRAKLEKIPGVSNVRSVRDEENFRFGIHFDFADLAALNRALQNMDKDGPAPANIAYFSMSKSSFERRPIVGFKQALEKSMQKGGDGESPGDKPDFNPSLLGIRFLYITEYTFPAEVRTVSNPRAQVMGDRRTVRLEHSMFDPDQSETNVGNRVEFKRWYHTCLPFL